MRGIAIVQIERFIFWDDLFEFRFDTWGILVNGQLNKFFDLLVEPIEVVVISFQDKDLFMS